MTMQVIMGLLGLFLAGVVLAVWGWRGRRINADPVCRDCGFNLLNLAAGTVTCPECGGGLKRAKAIRIGERRRMPLVVVVGLVLALIPTAPLGVMVISSLTGQSLSGFPFSLLLLQSRFASGEHLRRIAVELERRILANSLSKEQVRVAVERTLELQGDWNNPWFEEWGQVIEAAKAVGELSAAQEALWDANAPRMELVARSPVRAGDLVRVYPHVLGSHTSSNKKGFFYLTVESATIDGLDATVTEGAGWARPLYRGEKLGQIDYQGSKPPPTNYGTFIQADGVLKVPEHMKPGTHALVVTLAEQTAASRNQLDPSHPRTQLSTPIQITPADSPGIEVVPPTPELESKVRLALEPQKAKWILEIGPKLDRANRQWIWEPELTWQLSVNRFSGRLNPPVDLAMDVFAVGDDKQEVKVGTLTTERAYVTSLKQAVDDAKNKQYRQPQDSPRFLPEPVEGSIAIVYRPSTRVAQETLGITRIYGGEIRFDKVPVTYARIVDDKHETESKEATVRAAMAWFADRKKREGR